MPKITFVNEKREIEVPAGSNMRDVARKAGIQVHPSFPPFNCFGNGLCATCRVIVKDGMGNLSKQGLIEKISLNTIHAFESIGHEHDMRLACQTRVNGDCTIETRPPMNISGEVFWQKPYPNK